MAFEALVIAETLHKHLPDKGFDLLFPLLEKEIEKDRTRLTKKDLELLDKFTGNDLYTRLGMPYISSKRVLWKKIANTLPEDERISFLSSCIVCCHKDEIIPLLECGAIPTHEDIKHYIATDNQEAIKLMIFKKIKIPSRFMIDLFNPEWKGVIDYAKEYDYDITCDGELFTTVIGARNSKYVLIRIIKAGVTHPEMNKFAATYGNEEDIKIVHEVCPMTEECLLIAIRRLCNRAAICIYQLIRGDEVKPNDIDLLFHCRNYYFFAFLIKKVNIIERGEELFKHVIADRMTSYFDEKQPCNLILEQGVKVTKDMLMISLEKESKYVIASLFQYGADISWITEEDLMKITDPEILLDRGLDKELYMRAMTKKMLKCISDI